MSRCLTVFAPARRAADLHFARLPVAALLSGALVWPALAVAAPPVAAPVSAAKPLAKGSSLAYTVQAGDTLDRVCKRFAVTADKCPTVALFNALENNKLPAAGGVVHVPLDALASKPEQVRLIQTAGDVKVNGQTAKAGARLDEATKVEAAADSSAVLEMADGSRVKVLPHSVADIVRSRNYASPESSTSGKILNWFGAKLRLAQGALETTVNKNSKQPRIKPMEVETTTSLIGVRGTEFRVAAADKYVPFDRAEVLEGTVSNINTWKNSEISLNAGQGAVVNPNAADMQAVALLPAPAVPAKGQVLRRPQAYWQFTAVPGATTYRVMAADDEAFNNIRYSEKTTVPQADLNRLANGKWYVRARGIDAQGLEGIDAVSTIDLRQPAWVWRNPSVQLFQGRLRMIWTDVSTANLAPLPGTTTVKADISRSKRFDKPLATLTSASREMQLPSLAAGTYYLRVTVDNDAIKNDEEQIFRFDLPADIGHLSYNVLVLGG